MNWLNDKRALLRTFCDENKKLLLINLRVRHTQKTILQVLLLMLSIIDGSNIDTVHVIDFPFSDHSIVIAECRFDSLDKGFD